jgi:hypothetical protein
MRKLLVVAVGIGLAGCDGAEHEEVGLDVTGTAETGTAETDSEEPGRGAAGPDACNATRLVDEFEESAVRELTSDATHIYYVLWPCELDGCPPDVDEVRAVAKAGGAPTVLALEPGSITDNLAVAGGHVYWLRSRDKALMRVPTDGCEEPEVVHETSTLRGYLAANADGVYWRSVDENELYTRLERLPLEGGEVEAVAILPPQASFSLLDDERLYFLTGNSAADAFLNAVDLDTGETQALTVEPDSFGGGGFTQDADALQWSASNGLRRLAKSGARR